MGNGQSCGDPAAGPGVWADVGVALTEPPTPCGCPYLGAIGAAELESHPPGLGLPGMSVSWLVPALALEPNRPRRFWMGLCDAGLRPVHFGSHPLEARSTPSHNHHRCLHTLPGVPRETPGAALDCPLLGPPSTDPLSPLKPLSSRSPSLAGCQSPRVLGPVTGPTFWKCHPSAPRPPQLENAGNGCVLALPF